MRPLIRKALRTVSSSVSAVPAGFWVRDALGLERNHYDRLWAARLVNPELGMAFVRHVR